MSSRKPANPEEIQKEFQEALNEEGFGFHYAVLGLMQTLAEQRKSMWRLERAEFPVMVRGSATRIDFVLRRADPFGRPDVPLYYMLAECKRANPAYSDWCFVKAPFTGASPNDGYVFQDRARRVYEETVLAEATRQYFGSSEHPIYHIAIEVKCDEKGNRSGYAKGTIENALTQVLRGSNGMLEYLSQHPRVFPPGNRISLLPVIFTTARLWASEVDLRTTDLPSGNTDLSGSGFRPVDWLLFEYNMSPGLKHTIQLSGDDGQQGDISIAVEREYVRTIAIVNAAGIQKFVEWSHQLEVG